MRIEGPNINSVTELQMQKAKSAAPAANAGPLQMDTVQLSGDAGAIRAAHEAIAQTPDIRADKVDNLRRMVQNGTYHVSALDIAKKMLTESKLSELGNK